MWLSFPAFLELLLRAAAVWLGLLAVAFLNGALRELVLLRQMGAGQRAHQLSVATGILLWTAFTSALWSWLRIATLSQAVLVGAAWMAATVLFETFVLNREMSWDEILQTYNLAEGELWGLCVAWIGLMPVFLYLVF